MNIKEMRILQNVRNLRTERRLVEMKQSDKILARAKDKLSHFETQHSTALEKHEVLRREHYTAMFARPMLKRDLEINASIQENSKLALQKNYLSVQEQSVVVDQCSQKNALARENYRGAVKKVEKTKIFLTRLGSASKKARVKQEEG
jgi:hypothetical protein